MDGETQMSHGGRKRREDQRLITGTGRFCADWDLPNQAHAQFLRADRAHAKILSIDSAAALATPGVLMVLTGQDIAHAGFQGLETMARVPGKGGTVLRCPLRRVLAQDRVRFAGEPVALVIAETAAAAQDGAEQIFIDYEDLPVVVEARDALEPGAPQLHDDVPGNLAVDYEYGKEAPVTEALAHAATTVQLRLDANRIAGNPMEPKSCLAAYDAATGSYDLYLPHQGMAGIMQEFAHVMQDKPENFRVHAHDVGGAFGVRNEAYPEFLAMALAAKQLGRPVKWVGTRAETIISDHHGRAAELNGTLALDANGKFLALRIEWIVNVGAWCSQAGPFINTLAAPTTMAANLYQFPALSGLNRLIFTNTTPTTAYRGAGRPNAAYLVEALIDEAALKTGIDRVELRRRNLIPTPSFPYATPTGSTYDSGDPTGLLDAALSAADWPGFAARRAVSKANGKLRGQGLALFIEPSGGGGQEEVAIRFDPTGAPILYSLAGPSGQGYETAYAQLVAEVLGIDEDRIIVRSSDPAGPRLKGTGSFGSRSLISHGNGLFLAAQEIVTKARDLAARELEVDAADVTFDAGTYRVAGTDLSITLDAISRKYASQPDNPLDTTLTGPARAAFPSGAHVAEVEIDRETGSVTIDRYVAVDDCGRVLNEMLVEGQLQGGLMQGIGQALGEHCVYEPETGQLLSGTFMDYVMPRADDLPELTLHHRPTLSPTNALGAKGAGEAGATGSIPAIASAVRDALTQIGAPRVDMPYTPSRVWSAIRGAA
jgi:aerobic carbon-monoxide dehydrogenase large subunit